MENGYGVPVNLDDAAHWYLAAEHFLLVEEIHIDHKGVE
jgi:hypothetical protein